MDDIFLLVNKEYKKHTGKTITMLAYEVDQLSKTVSILQQTLKTIMPAIAATVVKVEAINKISIDNGYYTNDQIDRLSDTFLLESKIQCI